jgi:lipid-binding SYLF domain-containing protein
VARAQLADVAERNVMETTLLAFALAAIAFFGPATGFAASPAKPIDKEVRAALSTLYEAEPGAKALGAQAKGILVFPTVRRAGLVIGGQHGDGALLKKGKIVDYYTTNAISVGLEAGAQSYSFAVFFMTDAALSKFEKSDGFELGAEANVVVLDAGAAAGASTGTAGAPVYAVAFGQRGLMGGISLQGTRITKTKSDGK